jgi:DNA-binding XRE family transcriptional regulator
MDFFLEKNILPSLSGITFIRPKAVLKGVFAGSLKVVRPTLMGRRLWVSYPVVLCPSTLDDQGMAKPSPQFAGDPVLVALGEAIRRVRTGAGLSQEALAVDADLDRSYMGGIERGEHNMTVMNIVKIADALKLKPSTLLDSAGL